MSAPDLLLTECDRSSETQYFWYRQTLDISSSIGEPEGIRWWMFLCLLASWVLIYLIIMKGIESSGNVVYFTALFPYVVMTIFFIRGITLKGAGAGLAHMFYPKVTSYEPYNRTIKVKKNLKYINSIFSILIILI